MSARPTEAAAVPPPPRSCDTFVFVAGPGGPDVTVFGKNSDRPSEEEHEVVFVPGARHGADDKVQCTYIAVPQVQETFSVVLSKPRWMWGCEMGANDRGVVGGNEAIFTSMAGELGSERRLLGMDILRLALERGGCAREAAEICATLTEQYGQGGGCAEGDPGWTYENGYLFADGREAFIVETCGVHGWAIERIAPGQFRNISNGASIRRDIFAMKKGLQEEFRRRSWWDPSDGSLDWKAALSGGRGMSGALELAGRERAGREHLADLARDLEEGRLGAGDLRGLAERFIAVLRDEDSGICFRDLDGFNSTGSQVSLIPSRQEEVQAAQHLFTCASDPKTSTYKRFGFASAAGAPGSAEGPAGAPCSLELWRAHRRLALAAAARARRADVSSLPEGVRRQLADWEEAALAAVGQRSAASPADLVAACAQELALLSEQEAAG